MAPLVKALKSDSENFKTKVCVTAQHREMLDQVLEFFEIVPDYDLDLMRFAQNLHSLTSLIIEETKRYLKSSGPTIVLYMVTLRRQQLLQFCVLLWNKVCHIEAGLEPMINYPLFRGVESSNYRLLADIHFAPTLAFERIY